MKLTSCPFRVLIHGGSGGVGGNAIRLAKYQGAHVIAVTQCVNRSQMLTDLGADEVWDSLENAPVDAVPTRSGCSSS